MLGNLVYFVENNYFTERRRKLTSTNPDNCLFPKISTSTGNNYWGKLKQENKWVYLLCLQYLF